MTILVLNIAHGCKCNYNSQKQQIFKRRQYIKTRDENRLETDSFVTKHDDILYLRWSDFYVYALKQGGREKEGRTRELISAF